MALPADNEHRAPLPLWASEQLSFLEALQLLVNYGKISLANYSCLIN